ncbi:MAG TPA: cytochrome P450 [Acidimicrobiales bacterium]|jgi:cytochrome P450 family 142 subfamily A polypeptide 1|nr:cytochrome P450 [Acidimicrobiales bacterium]
MPLKGTHPRLDGLNLLDGRWYADDPHTVWSWMRREAPVYYDEAADVWGIARYDDVLAIEKDPKTFSSRRAPRPHGRSLPMMISMDDPDHRRRRSLVNRGFTPRRIAQLEDEVDGLCRRIIDRVSERGSCDFVWDIAAPLPLMVIASLLGFDEDAYDDLLRWSDDLLRATTLDPTPEVATAGMQAMLGFRAFQLDVIAERRATPRDDLISTLCGAEIDGHRLDDDSIVNETLLLLIGGDETTRHVISGGMLALLEHPAQLDALRSNADLIPLAVEELLRWVSPIKNMARTVTSDIEIRGQLLRAGDQLMLFYPSANRDESVFDRHDVLDVRRNPNPHLAFGFGPHFCLGAALARLELSVMFREVLGRLPDVELSSDAGLPYRASNFVSGLESMPVRFTPTARQR